MLENELVDECVSLMKKWDCCKGFKEEIPFLSRCIDVVYINQYDELVSIEFKIKDIRHAVEQAKNHKLGADKSYICTLKKNLNKKTIDYIVDENLGLLFYDPNKKQISEIIPAPTSKTNAKIFKNLLLLNYNKL